MQKLWQNRYCRFMLVLLATAYAGIGIELAMRGRSASRTPLPLSIDSGNSQAMLDFRIGSLKLANASLRESIEELRHLSGQEIYVPWEDLERRGIPLSPITLSLRDVTLRAAICVVLRCASRSLTYGVDESGLILVASDWRHACREIVIYDIHDIAPAPPSTDPPEQTNSNGSPDTRVPAAQRNLALLVTKVVRHPRPRGGAKSAPASHPWWDQPKTSAQIITYGGRLIVCDTPDNHWRIRKLLAQIRSQPGGTSLRDFVSSDDRPVP
jgi:hypothetical protein